MIRAALRSVGWVVSEVIPAQALRVAMNRDFHRVLAERDVAQHQAEVLRDALAQAEEETEVWEPHEPAGDCCTFHQPAEFDDDQVADPSWPVLPCYVCGQTYTPEGHVCRPSDSPVPPAGDTPTPVEPDSPLAPGVGTPDLLVSTFGPPPTMSSDLADLESRVTALEQHRHSYMGPDAGGYRHVTSTPKPNK